MEPDREDGWLEGVAASYQTMLRAVPVEVCEDHLRVALIQPGSGRYPQMSGRSIPARRVEPRIVRPLQL